jgi:hypothetical protein
LQKVPRIARGPGHGPHALTQLVLDLRLKLLLQLIEQGRLKQWRSGHGLKVWKNPSVVQPALPCRTKGNGLGRSAPYRSNNPVQNKPIARTTGLHLGPWPNMQG